MLKTWRDLEALPIDFKRRGLMLISICMLIISCGQRLNDVAIYESPAAPATVSSSELYEVLQFVIADQKLDRRMGLKIQPISIEHKFLLDRIKDNHDNSSAVEIKEGRLAVRDSLVFEFQPEKVLTHDDVDFMLKQTDMLNSFRWDNSRLGFNTGNTREWYEFSAPLFSRDSSKAVMLMYYSCDQFLCRRDTPILLVKDHGNWTAEAGPVVVH